MKRAVKYAAIGLAVTAAASIPHATRQEAVAAAPEKPEKVCAGEATDTTGARVRAGSHATEPNAAVSPKTAAAVEQALNQTARVSQSGRANALRAAVDEWISIPVWFHVLKDGKKGDVSKAMLQKQLDVLDATYRGKTGGYNAHVNFWIKGITRTNNKAWFTSPRKYEAAYKKKLHKGGKGTLNFYTANLGSELLGWATWPWDYKKKPKLDGVVVHYGSLPGSTIKNYNLGYSGTHETGHWLGLYHTFGRNYPSQDGCEAGDRVTDTPDESEPASGCPLIAPDTCDAPGTDPIHNFMDYSYDTCMTQFTAGQSTRLHNTWKHYRAP
ncbi:zinc metalloprotease [Actinocorallia longicatena]|uniref:Zinc metalloprotease n=1 Tax=Actinocorallia longicatena TaxID=111803 RepID=A0ABP6QH30_9ACTN